MIAGFLALNRECESQLWPLTEDELRALLDIAYFAKLTGDGQAMLIAFDERAPYESPEPSLVSRALSALRLRRSRRRLGERARSRPGAQALRRTDDEGARRWTHGHLRRSLQRSAQPAVRCISRRNGFHRSRPRATARTAAAKRFVTSSANSDYCTKCTSAGTCGGVLIETNRSFPPDVSTSPAWFVPIGITIIMPGCSGTWLFPSHSVPVPASTI